MPRRERKIEIVAEVEDLQIELTYKPSAIHLSSGDTVRWESTAGPFSVQFHDRTPGNHMGLYGDRTGGKWATEALTIGRTRGSYEYSVAIYLESTTDRRMRGRIGMDAGCPEIIVD